MGWWEEEARRAAARHFGARHWRWFAAIHYGRKVAPPVAAVGLLAAAVGGVWHFARLIPLSMVLLSAGGFAVVMFVVMAITQVTTGAGVRRAVAGRRSAGGMGWVLASLVLLVGVAFWSHWSHRS